MRNDSYSSVKEAQAIVPAVKTAAADGTTIDRQGFDSLLFIVNTGAISGDGEFGVKLQASADGTTWADADAEDVIGSIPATLAANSAYRVGYIGSKRYARLAVTKAGGTSIALGAVAVLGHPNMAPVA